MGFHADGIAHNLNCLIVGNISNFIYQRFNVLNLNGQFLQLFLLLLHLLFLLHQDIVLFFKIRTTAVFRFFLQVQAMFFCHIKKQCAADGIKSFLSVVGFPCFLCRIRKFKTKFLQCFFLLRGKLPILVLTIKNVPFVDMGRTFIHVQRPVKDMDMFTKPFFHLSQKICHNQKQDFRRCMVVYGSNLEDSFFWRCLFIFQ